MVNVIGVRFKSAEKVAYFTKGEETYCVGENVICKTSHGLEFGKVCVANKQIDTKNLNTPLKPVIRKATPKDIKIHKENLRLENEAISISEECIKKHKLYMKLISISYTFDRNKMLFFFTSENRVDFRSLVKNLAAIFHTRIELRQIGVRDEAKLLGGIGTCGKSFCCSTFLNGFYPVSIKMAKEQNLSLNPSKISGCCGRLMCCLEYEQNTYNYLNKISPKSGDVVKTPEGEGTVVDGNTLTGEYRVKMADSPDAIPKIFNRNFLKILKKTKIQDKR